MDELGELICAGERYFQWRDVIEKRLGGNVPLGDEVPLEVRDTSFAVLGILQKNFVELVKLRVAAEVRHAELEERLVREIEELQG